jgi:hypothetical protein
MTPENEVRGAIVKMEIGLPRTLFRCLQSCINGRHFVNPGEFSAEMRIQARQIHEFDTCMTVPWKEEC